MAISTYKVEIAMFGDYIQPISFTIIGLNIEIASV